VNLALSALSDELRRIDDAPDKQVFGPSLVARFIEPTIIDLMFGWSKEIRTDIQNGKPPRTIALWPTLRVARDYVGSGRFHIYRGV
jgi:hypothetical protein